MKTQTTFNERLARISAREGMGAELLAGVCETETRPKVKMPKEKKKRSKNGNPIFLTLVALGLLGAGFVYQDPSLIQDIDFASLTSDIQNKIEVTKVEFASYME